ncbi:hypothetical protein EVA_20681 [gut metagenome]|uniref:Uncharacterized protein n=1 Tax=gut metagenome TaxID=749906 RepID=J9F9T7_9ZZZZ
MALISRGIMSPLRFDDQIRRADIRSTSSRAIRTQTVIHFHLNTKPHYGARRPLPPQVNESSTDSSG